MFTRRRTLRGVAAVAYTGTIAILGLLAQRGRSRRSLEAKIIVLRHQLAVLARTAPTPRYTNTNRAILAGLSRLSAVPLYTRSATKPNGFSALGQPSRTRAASGTKPSRPSPSTRPDGRPRD